MGGYVVNENGRVKSHYFIADVKRFMEVHPKVIFCYIPIIPGPTASVVSGG